MVHNGNRVCVTCQQTIKWKLVGINPVIIGRNIEEFINLHSETSNMWCSANADVEVQCCVQCVGLYATISSIINMFKSISFEKSIGAGFYFCRIWWQQKSKTKRFNKLAGFPQKTQFEKCRLLKCSQFENLKSEKVGIIRNQTLAKMSKI